MTLPRVDDEQRAALFNRGNHFRRTGDFDKALAIYENIVRQDDTDAEAHWCCALCRFGIEYVEDPTTFEYIPTCHRASFDSILEDVDYKAALEHSDGITRRQYQKDAAKIAEVQRGILATVNQEEPFDVFLCYKETDEQTGQRSRDSLDAQEVYYRLTEKGYRVFFARVTLEDKAGAEYEPYIFAALQSARVMIVLGEKPEHFSAVWVKNEWSRYLALMKKDRKRLLIPCYKNMDPYDLPEQLSVLQSYDMSRIGFIQDLIRGVGKVLDADKPKEEPAVREVVREVVQQSAGGANLTAQLKRGQQALEDRDWAAADGFFDKALDMDAECAEAFFGKALAAAQCASGDELVQKRLAIPVTKTETLTACEPDTARIEKAVKELPLASYLTQEQIRNCFRFDERSYPSLTAAWNQRIQDEEMYWTRDRLLSRAVRYARGDFAKFIQSLRSRIEESLKKSCANSAEIDKQNKEKTLVCYEKEMQAAEEKANALRTASEERQEADYDAACARQSEAKTKEAFSAVATRFERLRSFKDSDERAKQCRNEAERLRAEAEAEEARRKAEAEAEKARRRAEAEAKAAAEKKAAEEKAERERIEAEKAERARKARNKKIAIIAAVAVVVIVAAFLIVTKVIIPASNYKQAEALLAAGDYDGAVAAFTELGDYKDSAERIPKTYYAKAETLLAAGDKAGAAVAFGASNDSDARERSLALWEEIAARNTIAAGTYHTIGLRSDGTVVAVGSNSYGQCDVSGWTDVVAIAAGASHTIGLRSDGTVVAVGNNSHGQCDVSGWTDVLAIAAGASHTIGLRSDGTVVAVGSNSYGQCDVSGWTDVVAVAAGMHHTVGLRSDGTVVAVGNNGSGQCSVSGWTDVVAVAAGTYHTVGLRSDGTVVAVGYNNDGRCDVSAWTDVVAAAAGGSHTVGLRSNSTVVAVGNNSDGRCGVNGWTDIVAVAAGGSHTVGLRSDGTVVAVGSNSYGQCGVSDWTDIKLPNR